MQRMLAAARRGRLSPSRAVLVDDLSRLSRDLGNTWRIVFEDLAAADVRVIDCTTGMAAMPSPSPSTSSRARSSLVERARRVARLQAAVPDQMARRIRSRKPTAKSERAALENEVTSQETRVRCVTEAFAAVGQSEALVAQLRKEEARLRELRARLASFQLPPQPAPVAGSAPTRRVAL